MSDKIVKYIKTKCGITDYNKLKALSKKNIFYRIRFYWFVGIAILRDLFN